MKNLLLFLLTISFLSPGIAWSKVFIDINQVSTDSFPIAIVPPAKDGGEKDSSNLNEIFAETVRKDLELMGIFRKIDPKAFLEDPSKKAFTKEKIEWGSWALLDALGLVKGWYHVEGKRITLEAHLFDVLAKSELFAKRYEGTVDQIKMIGHKFANEIMKVFTGEEGLFDTQIAFVCEPKLHRGPCERCPEANSCKPHRHKELCVMNFDGTNVRQLTRYRSEVLSPTWSKDGQSIYFTSFAGTKRFELYRYDLRSSIITKLSSFQGMTIGLSLDPLQNFLATSLTKDGNAELYLLQPNGRVQSRLTTNDDIDVSASFSPDGRELVFVSDRAGSTQIYKTNRAGQGAKRMTFKGNRNESPAWSPRGDTLVFSGLDTDRLYDIFSMNRDGSNMVRLTYDSRDNQEPDWAPGGRLIVFSSNRNGRYQLWSMRPDGTKQMQLTKDRWNHSMPVWGPKPK